MADSGTTGPAFLGSGWAFPVALDASGAIARSVGGQSIQNAIWLLLATAKGERVMQPDFGCGIHDLVFAVANATTAGRVAAEVRDALVRWEPRIDVSAVDVTTGPANVLQIRIEYIVRATNARFNLVYPFYLQDSPA
jgi:phage baseplate assembly protein W